VNEVEETGFKRGDKESVARFASVLTDAKITATVRRRLGGDVNASCGQLRRNSAKDGEK
jgi:23S rRNA (adenine2503-C2)-methyltransferase